MKKSLFVLMPILLAVVGCADVRLANGKYTTSLPGRADEIKAFFEYVEKGVEPPYTFAEDAHTLAVVDEIEGIAR